MGNNQSQMIPASADIVREHWPVEIEKSLNLYLGTGRCGGCFDSYGLQHQSDADPSSTRVSNTRLIHADVWHRGTHGLDNQTPLTRIVWSEPPAAPQNYRQHLHLADVSLTTDFEGLDFKYTLVNRTSPAEADRDLIRFDIRWEGAKRPVQLNQLWILPLGRQPDEPTRTAYAKRRIVCSSERDGQRHPGIPTGFYDGWTLFAFLLSAATLGAAVGHAHEIREMIPSRLIDPDYITVYESSGFWKPYYTTSMGLFMQAARKFSETRHAG